MRPVIRRKGILTNVLESTVEGERSRGRKSLTDDINRGNYKKTKNKSGTRTIGGNTGARDLPIDRAPENE